MYGALLGAAGGVVSGIGARKTEKALERADKRYRRDLDAYYGREDAMSRELRGRYQDVDQSRLNRMGTMLDEYMAPGYGQEPGDTATTRQALRTVGSGLGSLGTGGAGSKWGRALERQNANDVGRQTQIAGDASMLRRIGDRQGLALTDMGIADQKFGRDVQDIASEEQIRRAEMARALQRLNSQAQRRFDNAGRAGRDWMAVGSMLGAGGSILDEWSAGNRPSGYSAELGYNPDTENRGSYITGYYRH